MPSIGFSSTKGTCLYAAAWKTRSILCELKLASENHYYKYHQEMKLLKFSNDQ